MASPNHKAGLAVVVPASDNRSQPRGKVKQNAFTSPRKSSSQPNGMVFHRSSTEARNVPPYLDGFTSPCQPNGPSAFSPSHGSTEQNTNGTGRPYVNGTAAQPPNGIVSHEPKGVVPARRRLLEVDEALQYSPFSSIVPFGSGTSYPKNWARYQLIAQVLYQYPMPTFLAHSKYSRPYQSSVPLDSL